MRVLTQSKANMDHGSRSGGPHSVYAGLSVENRVLAEASSAVSKSLSMPPSWATQTSFSPSLSLQPSRLSSTTSSSPLFSPVTPTHVTSTSSTLLNTENTQLKRSSLLFPPLSSHSTPLNPSLTTTLTPSVGVSAPICSWPAPPEVYMRERGKSLCSSEDLQSHDETLSQDSECGGFECEDTALSAEMPVLDLGLDDQEEETVVLDEEFGKPETDKNEQMEDLKDKKYRLLNEVCSSLVNKSCTPTSNSRHVESSVWNRIIRLAEDIALKDPQFLLKVAVYTRQELNIRATANFLLALAAHLPDTKPHLRRYFCAAVQLPSDWLEVTRLYGTCFSASLPSCLKKALVDKFKQFNEYQLAKYNTRKHRCKHSRKKKTAKKPSREQLKSWARLLGSDAESLEKYLQMGTRAAVDKRQSEFSLKNMIKRLHIKEPAEYIMAILGKRYPEDMKTFTRSGLSGVWQSERAGQRMKLTQPDTWDRKLTQEGNNAATWEKLLDSNSLPFMAMLRNLRNMITQGISEKHHQRILNKLTSKAAVMQSRQFPFRFLSAYKVIMELGETIGGPHKAVRSSQELLKDILKKMPKNRRSEGVCWQTAGRKRLRMSLAVPFVYRMFKKKHKLQMKANQQLYSQRLLDRYRQALETAIQISCRYNIPPLPGRTLVICSTTFREGHGCSGIKDLCLPPEPDASSQNAHLTASVQEVAVLLALMIGYCSENAQLMLSNSYGLTEAEFKSDIILENVRHVMKKVQDHSSDTETTPFSKFFCGIYGQQNKVDSIIVLDGDCCDIDLSREITKYQMDGNSNAVVVNVLLGSSSSDNQDVATGRNSVTLHGFSEQILKFISERGSSRLLDHIECIDKLYNIPPPQGTKDQIEQAADVSLLPATPKLRWRGVRVFISSTFRDMHAERDILVRSVFPELRRRAAPHCLYLQEVELRWGITEEETSRTVELCLSEVCRSQVLLGILGERYGLVPPRPSLPDLPQYSWLESAPSGLSITEMEIRQFEALFPDSAQSRMFFYFRSPHLSKSVPVAWRADFASESKEAEAKMDNLKKRLLNSHFNVTENYPCEWGGVVDGKPFVKGLEDFAKAVLDDLWAALLKLFVEETDETDLQSEIKEQEVYQDAQQRLFHGRGKLVSMAIEKVKESQEKGGIVLIDGVAGEGKTVFMAALAHALRTPNKSKKAHVCDVISYSTAASQSACRVEQLLRCLVLCLRRRKKQEEELAVNLSYRDLLVEFNSQLSEVRKGQPLALLIDGADLLDDARGQKVSEWIPQRLPKVREFTHTGVSLVLSVTSNSTLHQTVSKRRSSISFPLGPLSVPDRRDIVQKELAVYGKKLSDSAFNNQLQTLLMKKGAVSPLYLHLACEELRNYASFEKMKESLQSLPQSLCELVQRSLLRLESQYGSAGLGWALGALAVSKTGLRERDLYTILCMCNDLTTQGGRATWQDMLRLARNPKSRVPMATFSQLGRTLESLISPSLARGPDDCLTLTNPEVRSAFEQILLSTEEDQNRAHLIMAAHLWVRSDPQGKNTFLYCDLDTLIQLPHHLMNCGQWEAMHFLLSSYYFLYANVRHGLLHHLFETYMSFSKRNGQESESVCSDAPSDQNSMGDLEDCHRFLQCHAPLLSRWPGLFVQQALNEPCNTKAHAWAQDMLSKRGAHAVRWLNNTRETPDVTSELVSTFRSEPTCAVMSPCGKLLAVGTGGGTLHFIDTNTRQEVRSLASNCDGISGCVFLGEGLLGTTSYDGQIEVWNVENGFRTAHMNGHSNRITASDISPDKKHFATVSLDFNIKVWSSEKTKMVSSLSNPSPMNCVAFDPEGHLLAVGCWDGTVRVWKWLEQKSLMTLTGHKQSVRSLSFSPSSSLLCSGSLSGEVRLWSVSASACVGCYQAHRGSAQVLSFLQGGSVLLSAGSDSVVQLWSGGLGHSVAVLGEEKRQSHSTATDTASLCVAVARGYAAVGYHGDGVKLFSLESAEKVWSSEDLRISMLCLIWMESGETELLVSGGFDHRLRIWRRQKDNLEDLTLTGCFGVQGGPILALAQNSSHLASASDDFTIALWAKSDMTPQAWVEPSVLCVLRGHNGGVTCLSFSPNGDELLSGGKDKTLMVWKMDSSPPVLSQSIPHCHGDWVTGCNWTSNFVLSCSSDCSLRVWHKQTGSCVREILTTSSLSTLCCWGDLVMAGSADGLVMVWKWESGLEITRIQAHQSRLHHCTVISAQDKDRESKEEELMIATACEDGTVKLWHPLKVHHHGTLYGHSGGVQAAVLRQGSDPVFLTVSEDHSLRAWKFATAMESHPCKRGSVSAVCFMENGELLVCGYDTGRLEIWHHNSMVYWKQMSGGHIGAVTAMPDRQLAIGCSDCSVSVWKLDWTPQSCTARLCKVSSNTVPNPVKFLHYCSILLGTCVDGDVLNVMASEDRTIFRGSGEVRPLGFEGNDVKSTWLLGENNGQVELGFCFAMGSSTSVSSGFTCVSLSAEETEETEETNVSVTSEEIWDTCQRTFVSSEARRNWITAVAIQKDFVVCGDSRGNIWFNQPPRMTSWTERSPMHSDRVSVLRLTSSTIISASYDRTVKFWDRNSKKQTGLFVCGGPVVVLEVNPSHPNELVCGDAQGQFYVLSWRD
ncbi:telomerase protein component 1 [Chanos chanos]|uniref:Telomerase protein component 1 n=1 Tax=Chanos chanos TaxID=29144 RepID=A0A6J2V981_CHACN|nr:telomerase protein component 1 [Chanos chanos]